MLNLRSLLIAFLLLISFGNAYGQTDDWKQVSSTTSGFKIKYPSDWQAEEKWFWPVANFYFASPQVFDRDVFVGAGISICSQPKNFTSTSSDDRSACHQKDSHLSEIAKDKVVSEEDVYVNGVPVHRKVTEERYIPRYTYIYALLSTKTRDILISSSFPRQFGLEKYIPVFDQMLSTLQLIEAGETIEYSNSRYGFSLTYPSSWKSCPIGYYEIKNQIMRLVPDDKLCNGANAITITFAILKDAKSALPDPLDYLKMEKYGDIAPSKVGDADSVSGQRLDGSYLSRQSYLYTSGNGRKNLLGINELTDPQAKYQQQFADILASIRTLR